MPALKSILIANRGEIACRLIAACREMGIASIAIYAEPDSGALHTRLADRALAIGGTAPAESYLRADRILQVARSAGADAIHPGYGFLSENAAFAEACRDAGVIFIGPSPEAMRLLGDKVAAKVVAERAGVPTLPGYRGEDLRPSTLAREAGRIGYPLLVKAAAGGGGRGMRSVEGPDALAAAVESAAREAGAAFGDPRIFLERYLESPRHIEVQILADAHGTVLAVGERECSLQRRHQKVVEEAPSTAIDDTARRDLFEAAIAIARAASYVSAGTVEFLLDASGRFFFLEMNTRLQVEHPVTELVWGIDLVQAQIRIASGEPIGPEERALRPRGHAIEVRLYAEDPARRFAPSAGTLALASFPHLPGVRVDAGVETGDAVSVHYDPMLAKLIVHAGTREGAIARLRAALDACRIAGVATNRGYLRRIVAHPAFVRAELSTRFLDRHAPDLLAPADPPGIDLWLAAALALVHGGPDGNGAWRHAAVGRTLRLVSGEQRQIVALKEGADAVWRARVGEAEVSVRARWRGETLLLEGQGARRSIAVARDGAWLHLSGESGEATVTLVEPPDAAGGADQPDSAGNLSSPMPGIVVKVHVREGERVAARQPLITLEAMKMEHVIAAPVDGVVRRLPFAIGALVPAHTPLVELGAIAP